jgi:hypothetical protein
MTTCDCLSVEPINGGLSKDDRLIEDDRVRTANRARTAIFKKLLIDFLMSKKSTVLLWLSFD